MNLTYNEIDNLINEHSDKLYSNEYNFQQPITLIEDDDTIILRNIVCVYRFLHPDGSLEGEEACIFTLANGKCVLIENIKKLIDRAELELIKIRGFLTLEEAEEKALYICEYQNNVYYYEIEDASDSGVLIENGKVLIEGVLDALWYEPGVYKYKIAGRGWTLIENGKVLINGAYDCHWCEKGMYRYYNKNGNKFEVKDGVTTEIY